MSSCGSDAPSAEQATTTSPDLRVTESSVPRVEPVVLEMATWISTGIWSEVIGPAFEASHPGVQLEVAELSPEEFAEVVIEDISAGEGPDLITCRSFAPSLELFEAGSLTTVNDIVEAHDLSPLQRAPFSTFDGADTFCVPVAAVVNGLAFNQQILDELGLDVPETTSELLDLLRAVAADGRYEPIALGFGTARRAIIQFWNGIGPAFWKGEEGRLALISGAVTIDAAPFREFLEFARSVGQTLPKDPRQVSRDEALESFAAGRSAVMPVGSWDTELLGRAEFEFVLTPTLPRVVGDPCYVVYHPDFGVGVNAAGNVPAASTFADWTLSSAFADLYFPREPGYLSLVAPVQPAEGRLPEFEAWLDGCEITGRLFDQVVLRDNEVMMAEAGAAVAAVVAGELSPGQGLDRIERLIHVIGG